MIMQPTMRYFILFRALNLDGKGENRFKTGGSMVNLKDNLVGKKIVKTESWRTRSTNSLLGIIFKYYQMQYYELLIAGGFEY